jgi:hypothetical protein
VELIKLELDHAGMRKLLRSDGVRAELARRAAAIAERAGDGFAHDSSIGRNRALAMVWADNADAQRAEVKDLALTRAIDAGRA